MNYRFYGQADALQDQIWRYTCETWGEEQAEKYIYGLHEYLQQLANREIPWRLLPSSLVVPADLNINVYFGKYERHFIFFRELSDGGIGILSILHDSMNIPVRLVRDLGQIDK